MYRGGAGDRVILEVAPELVILSDGTGQFAVRCHAVCWIHAERVVAKLIPVTEQEQTALESAREDIWRFYDALKAYRQALDAAQKARLEDRFDEIAAGETGYAPLDDVLHRLAQHKSELLRVRDHPAVPLHNNGSEQAMREYVTRRKISGGTRSEAGRQSRDTFTSLTQTCRKLGISFWQYVLDRLGQQKAIPP